MANSFRTGQKVHWSWGAHSAQGYVVERFERRVRRTIAGSRIVRRGTAANPAYLVESDEGKAALKRGSALRAS